MLLPLERFSLVWRALGNKEQTATMINHLAKVRLYTPNLEEAIRFYQSLGLHVAGEAPARKGYRSVELGFAAGQAHLEIHDDPVLQFTDVVLEVSDVGAIYHQLRRDPAVLWLQLPTLTIHGWTASLRGPDGNVIGLVSRDAGNLR
jgi:catechol 2,3-dioxygenase-like lactoylglutathione lyase family enzyme